MPVRDVLRMQHDPSLLGVFLNDMIFTHTLAAFGSGPGKVRVWRICYEIDGVSMAAVF